MDDSMKYMLEFLNNMNGFGTDPMLADIMTKENRNTANFIKDSIHFISDIDFDIDLIDEEVVGILSMLNQAYDWEDEFVRGLLLGILVGLVTDESNPVGFKGEMAHLYRLLHAHNLERKFA